MSEYVRAFIALSPVSILFAISFDVTDWQWWLSLPAIIWCVVLYPQEKP